MINSCLNFSKITRFNDLIESVKHCDLCPRLNQRKKIFSLANGSINSKVLFVAEAPGRLGADRTGVPLHGDRTGNNFESLLGNIGWQREDIFITNAILCNPQKENGNNSSPSLIEIANCSTYLEMIITLVNPDVIVSLGTAALETLEIISPHGVKLRESKAQPIPWRSILLFPLYHPGPRATLHRSLPKQRSDFMLLSKLVHPTKGLLERKAKRNKNTSVLEFTAIPFHHVVRALIELCGKITYFKLTKLLYLIDYFTLQQLGHTVANDIYIRQVDGPWPPKLDSALSSMQGREIHRSFMRNIPIVDLGPSPRFDVQLEHDVLDIIYKVFSTYGSLNNLELKAAVYRTGPMQFILKEEQKGMDMRNKPILYKNKTIIDSIK